MFYKNFLIIFLIAINVYALLNVNSFSDLQEIISSKVVNTNADKYQIVIKKNLNSIFYFHDKNYNKNIKKILLNKKYKNHIKFSLNINELKSNLIYKEFNLSKLPVIVVGNKLTGFKIIKQK